MKKNQQRLSDERQMRILVFSTVTKLLNVKRNGLKLRPAIKMFCKFQGLEIEGNLIDFMVNLYNSNTNKYIRRGIKKEGAPNKNTIIVKNKNIPNISRSERKSYHKFLRGAYWTYVRRIILKRDNSECQKCNATKKLKVHHKTYKNHFNEHNNLQDLITLCENCHSIEHNKDLTI